MIMIVIDDDGGGQWLRPGTRLNNVVSIESHDFSFLILTISYCIPILTSPVIQIVLPFRFIQY